MMERALFLKSWLSHPMETGALAPSSTSLARLMTQAIDPARGPVLELGPGTGVFTRHILATGLPVHDLVLVEKHPDFVRHLRRQYPGVRIEQMDVTRMRTGQHPGPAWRVQAVISGLPLLSMGAKAQLSVLQASPAFMQREAGFYQFTYHWRCPIPAPVLDHLGLVARPVGRAWRNLPPAWVFRIGRAHEVRSP